MFLPLRLPPLQGLLPFEVPGAIEDNMNTEAAMDEFQEGPLEADPAAAEDSRHQGDYSHQVELYTQNKPRKKSKNKERELQ